MVFITSVGDILIWKIDQPGQIFKKIVLNSSDLNSFFLLDSLNILIVVNKIDSINANY